MPAYAQGRDPRSRRPAVLPPPRHLPRHHQAAAGQAKRGARLWPRLKPLLSAAQEWIMAPLTGAERQTFLDFLTRFGLDDCAQVTGHGIDCRTATGPAAS